MSNQTTAEFLTQQSKEICDMNHCTEDEHFCESYAYFNKEHILLDVCYPDYFLGYSGPVATIPLPWHGTQEDLKANIDDQIAELES
jgi:hypothetical protein